MKEGSYIFDVESDGFLDVATKIHVLSYREVGTTKVNSLFDYDDIRAFLLSAKELIGHKITEFDIPLVEKLLGIKVECRLIDTLPLSWYLNHKRKIHGLDAYGKLFGVEKPKVLDWLGLTREDYQHRCEEDVKINTLLYDQLMEKLSLIYNYDQKAMDRLIDYLGFKMDCLRQQEHDRWKLDVTYCQKGIDTIQPILDEKTEELITYMPMVDKIAKRTKPAKPYNKNGELSATGIKWSDLLASKGLPSDYSGVVEVKVGEEPPNPGSPDQVKVWLFSLGWEPENFDYKDNGDGTKRKVPQVRIKGESGKVLCPSVLALVDENPGVAVLDGVTVLGHRLSTLKGFLKNEKGGYLMARSQGFTNTLRFKHTEIVNLPGIDKDWGKDIRGCLIAPDGYELCGSDMCSLEDSTKRHYMFKYDPEYVLEMSREGFDSHLDLAQFAGAVTAQEVLDYVCKKVGSKNLKPIRKNFKEANYSCVYGVGKDTLSRTLKVGTGEAAKLIKAYWARNWAVLKVAEAVVTKTIMGEMWLFNPISRFWYSLRYDKDRFSTLNQGTGVYCFDLWVKEFRKIRPQLTGQFHDEVVLCIKKGSREKCRNLLNGAIDKVNKVLKLNVQLAVDIQFGDSYADIH